MSETLSRISTALADRYRIDRHLGEGGMATVYLAQDVKHDRQVAIKVLRPELAAVIGASRFLQEIKVTANLQHPHILQLYDSGEADGFLYYVMPFIEGESLRGRLQREKQLGVEDAVSVARAVASALDYAHRHDIVHRDIKPENILLHDGQPVVADFGIALALSAAGGTRLTETGLSLGTPHYMSPEQAMGDREVDARADVYALGCVAYEMLAGEPPYTGPTAQSIVAKLLTEKPRRLTLHRDTVPPGVEAAIHKALEKLPADRFHSAAEFAAALGRMEAATAAGLPAAGRAISRVRAKAWGLGLGIAAALVVGFALGRLSAPPAPAGPFARFAISVEPTSLIIGALGPQVALSPDGQLIGFAGRSPRGSQIYIRALADSVPRAVPGTEHSNGLAPFFSPDGRWLGFWANNSLWRVAIEGGVAERLANDADFYAAWTADGAIVYMSTDRSAIYLMDRQGNRREIARSDTARFLGVDPLPGGRAVLTALQVGGGNRTTVVAVSYEDGAIEPIGLPDALVAKWVPSGHVVYQPRLGGPLYAAPFDLDTRRATGSGRQIAPEASVAFRVYGQWDVSDNGSIVYIRPEPFQIVMVDRSGAVTPLRQEPRSYHHPRFSPDGRRVAMDLTEAGERDVWILQVGDRTLTRLTVGEVANDPFWSPDGRRLAYTALRGAIRGIFIRNADGSGTPDSVYWDQHDRSSGDWSRDGATIVSSTLGLAGLWRVPLDGSGTAERITESRSGEMYPDLSPDGRWLAYVSDESGRREVYVRPFPAGGGRTQVSVDGGSEPVWSPDGREILYRESGARDFLIAARVRTQPDFEVIDRTPLFDISDYGPAEDHANYDIHPDGQRFVMVHNPRPIEIHLIQNWSDVLDAVGR
ncbi:MAG TPA: protein kinase [Gemmatimonadales bacterium]